jgi:hypothetical protein
MERINENHRAMSFVQHRDFMRGLPFYGQKGDFNFVTGRSQFTPGVSVKVVALTDLSHKGDPGFTEFDQYINTVRKMFKPGDRVRAIEMNSMLKEEEDGDQIVGKLDNIKIDRRNEQIRAFIKDPETLKITEVYTDSLERIYESASFIQESSYVKDFSTFIGSL